MKKNHHCLSSLAGPVPRTIEIALWPLPIVLLPLQQSWQTLLLVTLSSKIIRHSARYAIPRLKKAQLFHIIFGSAIITTCGRGLIDRSGSKFFFSSYFFPPGLRGALLRKMHACNPSFFFYLACSEAETGYSSDI